MAMANMGSDSVTKLGKRKLEATNTPLNNLIIGAAQQNYNATLDFATDPIESTPGPPPLTMSKKKAGTIKMKARSITIGNWHREFIKSDEDVVAKCLQGRKRLVWEFYDFTNQCMQKIDVGWENIYSMKAIMNKNEPGILEVKVKQLPKFFIEKPPTKINSSTCWTPTADFTDHQAHFCPHIIKFSPNELEKHFERLLDTELLRSVLSPQPNTILLNNSSHHNYYCNSSNAMGKKSNNHTITSTTHHQSCPTAEIQYPLSSSVYGQHVDESMINNMNMSSSTSEVYYSQVDYIKPSLMAHDQFKSPYCDLWSNTTILDHHRQSHVGLNSSLPGCQDVDMLMINNINESSSELYPCDYIQPSFTTHDLSVMPNDLWSNPIHSQNLQNLSVDHSEGLNPSVPDESTNSDESSIFGSLDTALITPKFNNYITSEYPTLDISKIIRQNFNVDFQSFDIRKIIQNSKDDSQSLFTICEEGLLYSRDEGKD